MKNAANMAWIMILLDATIYSIKSYTEAMKMEENIFPINYVPWYAWLCIPEYGGTSF